MNPQQASQPASPNLSAPQPQQPPPPSSSPEDLIQQQVLDLLTSLDDPSHEPLLPESLLDYHCIRGGLDPDAMPRAAKNLLSLMTEKFVLDVVADASGYARMRTSNTSSSGTKLTVEDVQAALADRDIVIKRPPYHL